MVLGVTKFVLKKGKIVCPQFSVCGCDIAACCPLVSDRMKVASNWMRCHVEILSQC